MLKQPDRIVVYPQKDSEPDNLLCWIPPSNFSFVSGDNTETETELKEYYPTGIETEFSQESFDEFGISLPSNYDLDALLESYFKLSKVGMFDHINFVNLKKLQKYNGEKDTPKIQKLVEKFSNKDMTLEEWYEFKHPYWGVAHADWKQVKKHVDEWNKAYPGKVDTKRIKSTQKTRTHCINSSVLEKGRKNVSENTT